MPSRVWLPFYPPRHVQRDESGCEPAREPVAACVEMNSRRHADVSRRDGIPRCAARGFYRFFTRAIVSTTDRRQRHVRRGLTRSNLDPPGLCQLAIDDFGLTFRIHM